MQKITTPEELYVWAYDMDGKAGDAVESIMHLLGDRLNADEGSLMMLCALAGDRHLTAEPQKSGVRLKSTDDFEDAYGVEVNVLLPHQAFVRYPNQGRDHLMFRWLEGSERDDG